MPLVGGFGCLELVLYGIRELAKQHCEPLILLQSEILNLVRGQTVRPRGGAGAGGAVGGVRAGPATTVHCLGRVTETVQRVELEARGTGLVADTALVTEVVLVARLGVLQLNKVLGPAQPPVRERVVALPGEENISLRSLKIFLQFYLAAEERPARQRTARVLK